jgi:hypothetical protein
MDFTIFDHPEHMTALSWLGRREWIVYKDVPEQRSIIARSRSLHIRPRTQPEDGGIVISEKEYNKFPPNMWIIIKEIFNQLEYDVVATFWYNTLSKALAGGPKIFRPTLEQCEALENAEARYAFKNYKQPFPVIILEIPDEYRNQLNQRYEIKDSPKYVFVNHDDRNRFINVSAFYNKQNIIAHVTPDRAEYATIEDSLIKNRSRRIGENIKGEFDAAENVQRLGINFAMMMSLYTVKVSGPIDPINYKIWQSEAGLKRKNGQFTNRAIEAQQKVAASMQLIRFDQSVDFYDEVEEHFEVAQGVDIEKLHKSPKSHWRRGHFAMQACGIGRRDRKMIFRKPVLVRAKYFLGDIKDASVTYTIRPRGTAVLPIATSEPTEPKLEGGQIIEVVNAEDCLVSSGTQGTISKIAKLGSNMLRIDAITADGQKFSLISPPDQYKIA